MHRIVHPGPAWRAAVIGLVLAGLAACGPAGSAAHGAAPPRASSAAGSATHSAGPPRTSTATDAPGRGAAAPRTSTGTDSPGRGAAAPLALLQIPGDITCLVLPAPAIGVRTWHTPVGFTTDWYVNQGRQPVTIQSVALIDPHGLVLHRGLVYEMVQAAHVLYQAIAWADLGRGALPSAWRARQAIPGAVLPPGHAENALTDLSSRDNLYVVAEEVTATSANGGWAAGEKITYISGGSSYSITAFTGIAIGSTRVPLSDRCDAQLAVIKADFRRTGITAG
jgi:hypothetical protein